MCKYINTTVSKDTFFVDPKLWTIVSGNDQYNNCLMSLCLGYYKSDCIIFFVVESIICTLQKTQYYDNLILIIGTDIDTLKLDLIL